MAEKFIYEKKGRDPFWPLITASGKVMQEPDVVSLNDISLEGILWDVEGNSMAMINGMILKKGDRIGNFEILKVGKDNVLLGTKTEQHLLKLEDSF